MLAAAHVTGVADCPQPGLDVPDARAEKLTVPVVLANDPVAGADGLSDAAADVAGVLAAELVGVAAGLI